ncbi:MAG: hypothetical protein H0Z29_06465 [Candidatus Marinimicrobia bacterium]|nr:hypothetical protein [Candidatus Neomarinimicrobiota bacterium]
MIYDELEVKRIVNNVVEKNNCYLLDVIINQRGSKLFIKVVADNMKGIDLNTLTSITNELRDSHEFNEVVHLDYELEVTSPGVDWPLREYRDFYKHIGREIEIFHNLPDCKSPELGKLVDVDIDGIIVETKGGENKKYLYSEIDHGRVKLRW